VARDKPAAAAVDPVRDPPDKDALLSPCGQYRYWLLRRWDWRYPAVCFVMLNPSTADAEADDPTIKKCCRLARAWGAGGIEVVNLFAFRATKPKVMAAAADPVGPENDAAVAEAAAPAASVVLGWGNSIPRQCRGRVAQVLALLARLGKAPQCLAVTKEGQPQHPLFVKETPPPKLIPYTFARE
jgi:hypothetical protein